MQLDNTYYYMLVNQIIQIFFDAFGEEMVLSNRVEHFEHMGYFQLLFKYCPLNYNILFESERDVFSIQINDSEGASNLLYRIEKYASHTEIANVKKAIEILKNNLEKNEFNFYICKDDKVYRKNANGIKRIKDLKELLNG